MHNLNRYSTSIICRVENADQKPCWPNLNKIASASLVTATTLVAWSYFFGQVTIAQTRPQQNLSKWEISQKNDPPVDEKEGGRTGGGSRFTSGSLSCYPNFSQT
ncbi:MAG: hypothetical protein U7123_04220 [Potamolinea sp.]